MNCFTKLRPSAFLNNINVTKHSSYTTVNKDATELKHTTGQSDEKKPKDLDHAIPIPIYSRKGDFGQTEINGKLLSKDHNIFKAIGATDELSSQLGFAKEFAKQHAYGDKLLRIQILLVNVITAIQNSHFMTEKEKVSFSPKYTKELEDWIDEYTKQLPRCDLYVLPGGGISSSALHVAKSVCRRAERNVIPLVQDGMIDKEILAYLNRLSDFLFTISRVACKMDKQDEYTTTAHHTNTTNSAADNSSTSSNTDTVTVSTLKENVK